MTGERLEAQQTIPLSHTCSRKGTMSWNRLDPQVQEIAVAVLTEKQLAAFKLELSGMSLRSVALHQGVARTTLKERLDATYKRLRAEGVNQDASGNWHLDREKQRA